MEALALAPGLPSLADQERRDLAPSGAYRKLYEMGSLRVAEGLHAQPPAQLWAAIIEAWGTPAHVVVDRFRLLELADAVGSAASIEPRVWQWSSAGFDIRALRTLVRDGPLALAPGSGPLVAHSLSVSVVKNDESGNVKMVKKGANNTARDDVGVAFALAAGAYMRAAVAPSEGIRVLAEPF